MQLIALCGQKGTGKDTVADVIVNILHDICTVRKVGFGNQVKDVICAAFGVSNPRGYNMLTHGTIQLPDGSERSGKEIARILNMRLRKLSASQFIERLEDEILAFKGYHPDLYENAVFVITDLRYREELKWCKAKKIPIIKVKRDSGVYDPHADELDIDDFLCDYFVDNNGSEQELKKEVEQVLLKIVK